MKCNSCHDIHPKFIGINHNVSPRYGRLADRVLSSLCSQDEYELSGGKNAKANFVWRCSSCKRESSAKFDEKALVKPYTVDANGQFAPLLIIECRGLEFVGFDPRVLYILCPPRPLQSDKLGSRVYGNASEQSPGWLSLMSILMRMNGLIMTKRYACSRISINFTIHDNVYQAAVPVGVSKVESQWSRA